MRITTNSILRNYQGNLNKSTQALAIARERALTGRKFAKISEDPASATKAFQLRKDYLKNEDHIENAANLKSQMVAADSSLMQIIDMAKDLTGDLSTAVNGTTSLEQREIIANKVEDMQKSMIQSLNAQFGGNYLFGGAGTKGHENPAGSGKFEPPFKLGEDGTLLYRGIDVNTTDPVELEKLKSLSSEELNIDIGFGLSTDASGKVNSSSAFNSALPGINVLGFGKGTETLEGGEQINNNFVTLLGQVSKELRKDPLNNENMDKLMNQFEVSRDKVINEVTQVGSKTNFLEKTEDRLINNRLTLNEKIVSVENMDLAQAITEYSWAQYAYTAALKVGTSVLSPSFIDFMR